MGNAIMMMDMFAKAMGNANSLGEIMAAMCSALDEWAMKNNVSMKELEETMEFCTKTMKDCHATEGLGW